ncbi:MAG: hypothetical protein HYY25_05050 [Candidatus Wallbacteria bacterium]|nr:hypothetical protein [Candidatus Wallbacteria bacterium]
MPDRPAYTEAATPRPGRDARRWLSVADVMREYGWARTKVYELARHITRYRPPGLGLLLDRQEIEAHIRRHALPPRGAAAIDLRARRASRSRALASVPAGDPHRHGL